jgi:hypothetical protein
VIRNLKLSRSLLQSGFLPLPAWELYLQLHLDQHLAGFRRCGIQSGFCIGFTPSSSLKSSGQNLASVSQLTSQVEDYIATELAAGKWLPAPPSTDLHTSPIGLIPKKGCTGKYRLIVDLSNPEGRSVNDGTDLNLCSFKFCGHCYRYCIEITIKVTNSVIGGHTQNIQLMWMQAKCKQKLMNGTCKPWILLQGIPLEKKVWNPLRWGNTLLYISQVG